MSEYDDEIRSRTLAGRSAATIAEGLGISRRTVFRRRVALGISAPPPKPFTAAELTQAKALLEDGCSYSEVARTLGRSISGVQLRFPGYGMPAGWYWANELNRLNKGVAS